MSGTGFPIIPPLRRGDTGGFLGEAIPRASAGKSPPRPPAVGRRTRPAVFVPAQRSRGLVVSWRGKPMFGIGRKRSDALNRRLWRGALLTFLAVGSQSGCTREFFRDWANQDAAEAVFEKSRDPRWRLD